MNGEDDEPAGTDAPLPPWQTSAGWWFRRVGAPLLAVVVIAGVIVWLQWPDAGADRRVAGADEPLESDGRAPQEGSAAPDFVLTTLDGGEARLSDFGGKVVLINFWATWCGPCREEMPLFEEAQQQFGTENLVILAVNVQESPGTVRPFVERLALTYPIVMDTKGSVARRYQVRSYPTTYFIGRDGRVEGRRVGAYTRSILFGRLEQLLDQP
jgi:thiol-disulfide isomerase/thioredoxin